MKDDNEVIKSTALLGCLVSETVGLLKPVSGEENSGQCISRSAYNNGIHDVLMLLYKKQNLNNEGG